MSAQRVRMREPQGITERIVDMALRGQMQHAICIFRDPKGEFKIRNIANHKTTFAAQQQMVDVVEVRCVGHFVENGEFLPEGIHYHSCAQRHDCR